MDYISITKDRLKEIRSAEQNRIDEWFDRSKVAEMSPQSARVLGYHEGIVEVIDALLGNSDNLFYAQYFEYQREDR